MLQRPAPSKVPRDMDLSEILMKLQHLMQEQSFGGQFSTEHILEAPKEASGCML